MLCNKGGERVDAAEMLPGFFRIRRHRHAIAFLQGQAQLQGINRVQAQAVNEERGLGVDVLRLNVLESQRRNDQFFDLLCE